ncbi:MAG: glutamyl-tRNA reductase [Cytophagaceae bacterium]|jgi:glutamyl-tRNA reductase|nr:glutamyl-tRNA reductase [Cytophagaceae bacterium]
MDHVFQSICLTYRKAPVDIREKISLDEPSCKRLMQQIKEFTDASELLILSTCNRTEIYYSAAVDLSDPIIKLLSVEKNIPGLIQQKEYFQIYQHSNEAIQHLFEVAMGLDSQVVGDMQITNQVKLAYQWSADLGFAGPFLHRLLHTIFFTNKRVVQETAFRDGAASVSYATAELAEELLQNRPNASVLVVGLGEMGADVIRNLSNSSLDNITITNRTLSKAQALAAECGVGYIPFEQLWPAVAKADLIISSVSVSEPLFSKQAIAALSIISHKYFIDLSVPRSVDSTAEELPGVIIYDIDHIQNRSNEALQKRLESVPHVKAIIEQSMTEFHEWSKEMIVSPTINKLKNALEQIRQDEMARYLKQLNPEEAKKVDEITKGIMQKIIKLPVLQLKAACKRGEAETLIDVLNDLFNLEKQSETHSH